MLKANVLKGKIVENNLTIPKVASMIGIAKVTFYRKLKSGAFTIGEVEKMCEILRINDPVEKCEIFLPTTSQ